MTMPLLAAIPCLLAQSMPVPPMPVDAGMLSATAVTAIIGAITTLVVGVIGKLKVDQAKAQASDVTLRKPVPTIETREKPVLVTKTDLDAHLNRIDGTIKEVKDSQVAYSNTNRVQTDQLHHRLNDQVKALSRMEGTLSSVQETTNTLLHLALGKKPTPRT
jgi:hypothetical protein